MLISDAFPRQLNPTGGTLITLKGAGFRDGLWCRTGFQEEAVMAAVSSSALLVCETLAVQDQNSRDAIHLSIMASRQQSSLSEMHDLVADGAKLKGAVSSVQARNTRIKEIMVEGQGFDIHLRNAWCKVGTVIVRGTVLSSSHLNCQLPFISRQCPALFVSFNQVDFTAVENMDWAYESCSSRKQLSQLPVAVEARSPNAAWRENIRDRLEEHVHSVNYKGTPHIVDKSNQPSVYSVYPSKSLRRGGVLHFVFGNSLSTQTFCKFNGFFVHSHYISSVLAVCEAPAYSDLGESWEVNVGNTFTGNHLIENGGNTVTVTHHLVLLGAKPESGSTDGGTLLHLTGTFNSETIQECKLSNIRMFNVRWVSSSQLECITPAQQKGKAYISIYSDQERQLTFDYVHDMYQDGLGEIRHSYKAVSSPEVSRVPKIMNFFPRVIGASGGTLTAAGISLSQELLHNVTGGHGSYVSSAIVLLEINSGSPGDYASLIEPVSMLDPQSARLLYEDEASITSVHPFSGSAEGGTTLVISGEHLNNVPELSCRIASFTPISGRWMGSTLAECISPAHRVETVVLGVANGPAIMPSDVEYTYHPTRVSLVGNVQQVDLIKEDWIESAHGGCTPSIQHETSASKRSQDELTTFDMTWTILVSACNAAPQYSGFQAAVVDGNRGVNAQVQYYYVSTPTVLAVIPQNIDSGRHHLVHVTGRNFEEATSFCTSGSIRSAATMISSAVVICELPDIGPGEVLVSVGVREASRNVGVVTFYEHPEVEEILPTSGPDEGGTLVSITMRMTKITQVQCKFGTVGPIAGRKALDTAFQCSSPAHFIGPCLFASIVSSTANSYSKMFQFHGVFHSPVGAMSAHPSQVDLQLCSMQNIMLESTLVSASSVVFDDHANSFCVVHASTVGFAAVIVSNSKPLFSSFLTKIQVEVAEAPVFHEIVPDSVVSSGGSLIQIFGHNMVSSDLTAHHCTFAHTTKPAHIISSAVILCEVPAALSPSLNDMDSISNERTPHAHSLGSNRGIVQLFSYVDLPSIDRLVPERGPSRGGTRLHVHGAQFRNTRDLSCKLGTFIVRAALISEQEILCVTPSHEHSSVAVDVAINSREGSGGVRVFDFLL